MVDIIASEYGWSDEYILNDLPYHRVIKLMQSISDRRKQEQNNKMVNRLFSTYQIRETLIAVNAGKKYKGKSFKKYLKDLGLSSLLKCNSKIKKSDYKSRIKKVKQNVEDAVNMFSKGGE